MIVTKLSVIFGIYVLWCSQGLLHAEGAEPSPELQSFTLEGTVTDEQRAAVSNPRVNVIILKRQPKTDPLAGSTIASVRGTTDTTQQGTFRIHVARADLADAIATYVFAYAEGYAIAYDILEPRTEQEAIELQLPDQKVVRGRVLAPNGDPLAGITIDLCSFRPTGASRELPYPFFVRPEDVIAWPKAVTTDSEGRFTLIGVPPEAEVAMETDDERVARDRWHVMIAGSTKELVIQTRDPRWAEGEVVDARTRIPIAESDVVLSAWRDGVFLGHSTARTDSLGRFYLRPHAGDRLAIRVLGDQSLYQKLERQIPWVEGTIIQRMTLPLYSHGAEIADETTPDGRAASAIGADHPPVEVVHVQPQKPLKATVSGTLLVEASIKEDNEVPTQGVFAVNPRTGTWRVLLKNAAMPRVSPDGRHLAYCSLPTGEAKLAVLKGGATEEGVVLTDKAAKHPAWLPNSKALVINVAAPAQREYRREKYWGEEQEHWVLDVNGARNDRIPLPPRYSAFDVAPDGQLIAMHWDTHSWSGAQLFVAQSNGTRLRPVARRPSQYYWYPRFSPDGKMLLAKHLDPRDGRHTVRTVALDGSHERAISVDDEYSPEIACWSPDGQYIAVAAYNNAALAGAKRTSKLFIVTSRGDAVREVPLNNWNGRAINDIDWTAHAIDPTSGRE